MNYIPKQEIVETILEHIPIKELTRLAYVVAHKDDTDADVTAKIEYLFFKKIPREKLLPYYNEIKTQQKYKNVGWIM